MGLFSKSPTPEPAPMRLLDPLEPPCEVVRGYTRREQTTLELYKKIMTLKEETSVVTDDNAAPVVQVSGPAFWINHFKTISDPSGAPLFKLRNKKAAIMRRFICEDPNGTELFTIQRKWNTLRVKLHATVPTTVGDAPTLVLLGNKRGFAAYITDLHSGAVVATVAHSYWKKDLVLKNKESYYVTVAPGVDLSVIVALCLAFDRCKEDDRRHHGGGT